MDSMMMHTVWRRLVGLVISCFCLVSMVWWVVHAWDDLNKDPFIELEKCEDGADCIDAGKLLREETIENENGVFARIARALGFDNGADELDPEVATNFIKEVINWFLAIMWLIATIVLLVWFYRMFFTTDHEEGFSRARKTVINAVIALVVIALSWFIVRWLFSIYEITLGG